MEIDIAYIHDHNNTGLQGYYYLVENNQGFKYSLFHCAHPPECYLKILYTMECYAIQQQCPRRHWG